MQRPKAMDEPPECHPLSNMDELMQWEARYQDSNNVASYQVDKNIKLPSGPRTLVCHDMNGGYLEDRFVQGASTDVAYRYFHWPYVDVFVYFSHHFVTIPPPCWTNAAHKHNTLCLGTIITEWQDGAELCAELLRSETSYKQVADRLVIVAQHHGFDGWLVNIENKIQPDRVWLLREFVHYLTKAMHAALPHSQVIWYDSVIDTGELKWQDQLCEKNKLFFDVCDGIFLNYCWGPDKLRDSSASACLSDRPWDVYVGVDVFGRNCLGGGGFNTSEAVAASRAANLSIAIFAQGWVYERYAEGNVEVFTPAEYKFWQLLSSYLSPHPLNSLPFYTSFCQGQGHALYNAGNVICDSLWTNLTFQSLQPLMMATSTATCEEKVQTIDFSHAFQGGACLKIGGKFAESKDYFYSKLFSFDTPPLSSVGPEVLVAYTVKCPASTLVWMDIELKHTTSDNDSQMIKYRLCSQSDATTLLNVLEDTDGAALTVLPMRNMREFENVVLLEASEKTGDVGGDDANVDNRPLLWETRCFRFSQLSGHCVSGLSVGMACTDPAETLPLSRTATLGQIQISSSKDLPVLPKFFPEVTSSQISQDEQKPHMVTVSCQLQWDVDQADCSLVAVDRFNIYCTQVPRGKNQLCASADCFWEQTKLVGRVPCTRALALQTFTLCSLEVNLDSCELLQFRVQPVRYNGISQPLGDVPLGELFLSLE